MKLLVITQSVDLDNPVLAFFHRWLVEFAANCERVTVVCLEKGRYDLPRNIRILSLGKERNGQDSNHAAMKKGRFEYVKLFYRYIWRERRNYDAVFVHMNPEYVILGAVMWRILRKRIVLWYTHRQVDLKLRIAAKLCDIIFTASKESFVLPSSKVIVMGHGIEVERFATEPRKKPIGKQPLRLIHVGRITQIKNCDILIEAAKILKSRWNKKFEIVFIGTPVTEGDRLYMKTLESLVEAQRSGSIVKFIGNVRQESIASEYASSDASINLTPTGGVDKAVLESMASALPVFSSNKAFIDYFGQYWSDLIFVERDAENLAQKIVNLFDQGDPVIVGAALQHTARERADVSVLIKHLAERIYQP